MSGQGWLRPALFGAMDGLVTNISLVAGVGGGGARPHLIVLTGVAGLVAGAVSMALGEYVSVGAQRDRLTSIPERDAVGAPWVAAVSSLLCFATGALIPLVPYLLGFVSLLASLIAGGAGLFLAGAMATRSTRRPWWVGGSRQVWFGAAAAAVTYAVGASIGAGH